MHVCVHMEKVSSFLTLIIYTSRWHHHRSPPQLLHSFYCLQYTGICKMSYKMTDFFFFLQYNGTIVLCGCRPVALICRSINNQVGSVGLTAESLSNPGETVNAESKTAKVKKNKRRAD